MDSVAELIMEKGQAEAGDNLINGKRRMITFADAFQTILKGDSAYSRTDGAEPNDCNEGLMGLFCEKGVALYGCGYVGKSVAAGFVRLGIPILDVCDTRRTGIFTITGQPILTPEELRHKHARATVLICTFYGCHEIEISDALGKLGFSDSQIFCYSKIYKLIPSFAIIPVDEFLAEHYAGYQFAYDQLSDDHSRKVLLDTVRMYLTGRPKTPSIGSTEYFDRDLIALSHGEVFIDGGAYNGETTIQFAKECVSAGVCNWKSYAFEANPQKQNTIVRNLAHFQNVEIVMKGLWSHDAELEFSLDPNDIGSSFYADEICATKVAATVVSLDAFFESKPMCEWPTFIKMDIESAEYEALRGARKILRNKCPKLALCVYHHVSHPYELLRFAQECNPDYRFYLRQHAMGYYETVLYAV